MSTGSTKILDDLSAIREEFYSSRRKNIFFKNSQKAECADYITTKMSIEDLVKNTVFLFKDEVIYIDYSVFKQYASPSNYEYIIKHLFQCIHHAIQSKGKYELHIHLATFSISAAERYKDFIQMFYSIYFLGEVDYGRYMSSMHIYYVPSMMNTISTILRNYMTDTMARHLSIQERIFTHNKQESASKLTELFGRTFSENLETTEDEDK